METTEFKHAKQYLLEHFQRNRLKELSVLRKENEFCDLTLTCDDGFEIKVHRVVVSSASSYFKALLTLPMKEKLEECISMSDITGDILEKIITFIYTSEFEEKIEDVEKIIKYAVIFQLQELVEICLLTLYKSINDHTCVKYWRLGRLNLISGLEDKCLIYIVRKLNHLFESSLMSELTIEEMKSLLAVNRLHLQFDENEIFEHVWIWAKSKVSETKNFSLVFSEVVDLLHFSKLEKDFVFQKLFGDNEDLLANLELLNKVARLTIQKHENEAPTSRLIFPKPTQRRLLGLLSNKMFIGLGEESTIENDVNFRLGFDCTIFDNKLLICGGENSNSCEFFEPSTQQWKNFPSMKIKKKLHRCLYLDNKIYACGGFDSKTIEIFDFGKGEWDYGPEMLATNWNFGLTGINGALYTIGGQTNNVEIFDFQTQKWNVICSDSRINQYVRCVPIGPCIYCFTADMRYIFDTRSNNFTDEISCINFKRSFSFCELDGYINGLGYRAHRRGKYSLNLIQYHLDGKEEFQKSFGLYYEDETTEPAIVSLYY